MLLGRGKASSRGVTLRGPRLRALGSPNLRALGSPNLQARPASPHADLALSSGSRLRGATALPSGSPGVMETVSPCRVASRGAGEVRGRWRLSGRPAAGSSSEPPLASAHKPAGLTLTSDTRQVCRLPLAVRLWVRPCPALGPLPPLQNLVVCKAPGRRP